MMTQTSRRRVSLIQQVSWILTGLVLMTVASASASVWFSRQTARNLQEMHQAADQVARISELQSAWLSVVGTLDTFSITQPSPEIKTTLDGKLDLLQQKLSELSTAGALGQSPALAQENQQIIADLQVTFGEVEVLANDIYTLAARNRWGAALQRRQAGLGALQARLEADLQQLHTNLQTDLTARSAAVSRSQAINRFLSLLAVLVAVGFAVVIARTGRQRVTRPMSTLIQQVQRITAGDFSPFEPLQRRDEIGELSQAINLMTEWLRESHEIQEQRVQARTQALEQRTAQVQAAAQVARDIASARNLEQLLSNAVELVRERLGFYHAGIFLTDARSEYQVLRAATGEAGRIMIERNHSLRIGQTGLVGLAAQSGEARISANVGQDDVHYKNPLLPETRSEAALPLKAGGRVIGVLDVQSREPHAFDEGSLNVLQLMADQLAIAIQNARLLEEIQKNLSDVQTAYGQLEQQAWLRFLRATPTQGYTYDGIDVRPLEAAHPSPAAGQPYSLSLRVRGQEIGALEVWPRTGELSEEEVYLLSTLSSRLSQIMESARLYEETQSRAAREETINRITAAIARSLDLDGVLRSATLELGRLPTVSEAAVVLDTLNGPQAADERAAGAPAAGPSNGAAAGHNGGSHGHRP